MCVMSAGAGEQVTTGRGWCQTGAVGDSVSEAAPVPVDLAVNEPAGNEALLARICRPSSSCAEVLLTQSTWPCRMASNAIAMMRRPVSPAISAVALDKRMLCMYIFTKG